MRSGFGGMLTFGVGATLSKSASDMGSEVVDGFKLISNLANVGDAKTLAIHPWTTTHKPLTDTEKAAAGVTEVSSVNVNLSILNMADGMVEGHDQSVSWSGTYRRHHFGHEPGLRSGSGAGTGSFEGSALIGICKGHASPKGGKKESWHTSQASLLGQSNVAKAITSKIVTRSYTAGFYQITPAR